MKLTFDPNNAIFGKLGKFGPSNGKKKLNNLLIGILKNMSLPLKISHFF